MGVPVRGDGRRRALTITVTDLGQRTLFRGDAALYEQTLEPRLLRQWLAGVIRAAHQEGMTDAAERDTLLIALGELPPRDPVRFLRAVA